jgi:hypothetical protein
VFKGISRGFGVAAIASDMSEINASLQPGGFQPNAFRAGAFFIADSASLFFSPLKLLPVSLRAFDLTTQKAAQSFYGTQE